MSVWGRDALDKLAANYLAFIHLASDEPNLDFDPLRNAR